MSQFTLYENQNPDSKDSYPYFIDVQNQLLDSLSSRVVIPLAPFVSLGKSNISTLCPVTTISGEDFVLLTHQLTSVPLSALKTPLASLEHMRDDVVAAIDFLVTGI